MTWLLLWTLAIASDDASPEDPPAPPETPLLDREGCASFQTLHVVQAPAPSRDAVDWKHGCFGMRFDIAGRGSLSVPATGVSTRLELARARLELGMWGPGPWSARIAFIERQSGGGSSYVGVDGEAWLPTIQIAEARIDVPRIGLSFAGGIVDDLWLMTNQTDWGLRPFANPVANAFGLYARSDAGAWISWTSPKNVATVSAGYASGEGNNRRERNNGKNITVVATVRPLATTRWGDLLRVSGTYTDGSLGVDSARNHRAGASVVADHDWVVGSLEAHFGWGLDGDTSLLPAAVSMWARTGDASPMIGWARADLRWASRDVADTRAVGWTLGAGPRLPWNRNARIQPIHVAIGYEGEALSSQARAVAGAEVGATTHTVWLQLGAVGNLGIPVRLPGRR